MLIVRTSVPLAFVCWNLEHLKPWRLNAGFSEQLIKEKFVGFGQGFKDMSSALPPFWKRSFATCDHPLLLMCASNAVIDRDPAGTGSSAKNARAVELTATVASTMAFGVALMWTAVKFGPEALIAQCIIAEQGGDCALKSLMASKSLFGHHLLSKSLNVLACVGPPGPTTEFLSR